MNIYFDCDGVILDTLPRLFQRKEHYGLYNHNNEDEFFEYFKKSDQIPGEWEYIIEGASSLNNSVEIIQELQFNKNVSILSKYFAKNEKRIKLVEFANNRYIYVPVILVPPGKEKFEIVDPKGHILVDDDKTNIDLWIEHGGIGYLFDPTLEENIGNKVKSLDFLLKK